MLKYNAVFDWKMTPDEIKIFKLAMIYQEEFLKIYNKETDNYKINVLPKKQDPRKSYLYRHCWKLARETAGLLSLDKYRLYIKANLTIIRKYNGLIQPNAICGDKAWIRWRVYERLYNKKMAELHQTPVPPSTKQISPKIVYEIDKTKRFIFEMCEGQPTLEKMKEFYQNEFLKLWAHQNKVSFYYLILSPFIAKIDNIDNIAKNIDFEYNLFINDITLSLKEYFQYEFQHEYV